MNKWFIIYCVYTVYSLAWNVASFTNNREDNRPEWAVATTFLILLIFKIGLVYLAVMEGF